MEEIFRSGIDELDQLIGGFFPGDNVVWQTDDLKEYSRFAKGFAKRAIADGRQCTYLRFAPHPKLLEARKGLSVVEVEPGPGFDVFTNRVHGIIEERGANSYYVFDNLSALVTEWATDELLAPRWGPYSVLGDGGFTLAASGRPPRPVPASYSTDCPSLREENSMP